MGCTFAGILSLFTLLSTCAGDNRRPIYNIAHMVNGIEIIKEYLDKGANMMEFDIQFYANGSVKEVYHGALCDFFRDCERRAKLRPYLEYLRNITDPLTTPSNYADQMVMQMFDLKLTNVKNLKGAGEDVARYVLDYLWSEDGQREQEVRVLIYIDDVKYSDTIVGFIEEFKNRGKESRLKDVGFDGGSGKIEEIRNMFDSLGVKDNIWIGDGSSNVFRFLRPDGRLRKEIETRDGNASFVDKVYDWTVDDKDLMERSLNLTVDGFITNVPENVVAVVKGKFNSTCRLATPADNPFVRYAG